MKKLVVFSGAGLSAESGIPTFRDSDGLWENHKVEDVADPDGWRRDPELVLRFYEQRFNAITNAEPNDAHKAIADLQDRYDVINYTQNIDNLLERAGCKDVRHMHGSVFRKKCEKHENTGDCAATCDFVDVCDEPIKLGDKCPKCDGQLRPDVVWFKEAVQFEFEEIIELCKEVKYNDGVFVCVGTSGNVQPAAALISFFSQVKRKFIVNKDARPIADYEILEGLATEGMRKLEQSL
jgi:NAD-dependent deacetylase